MSVLPHLACAVQSERACAKLKARAIKLAVYRKVLVRVVIAALPMLENLHEPIRHVEIVSSAVVNVGTYKSVDVHVNSTCRDCRRCIGTWRRLGYNDNLVVCVFQSLDSFDGLQLPDKSNVIYPKCG